MITRIAVISELCDRVAVMYAGRIVEELPAGALRPARHPYTRALIGSTPDMDTDRALPLVTIPGRQPPSTSPAWKASPECRCSLPRSSTAGSTTTPSARSPAAT
ncbi:ABC transporter ATP-binding protein [Streptomyces sp. NBC_01431]|uniref:ABC transporter ATP-binding protein n=1 Tax=Streptomyces sp. NBC_01431 TaxID=2903863 RepID=UPI002E34EAF7|nr:hypothetical protein [Streptomyces sp. NBC_01431]